MGQKWSKTGQGQGKTGVLGSVRRSPARCRPPTRPPPRNLPTPLPPREWGRAPLPPVMLRPGGWGSPTRGGTRGVLRGLRMSLVLGEGWGVAWAPLTHIGGVGGRAEFLEPVGQDELPPLVTPHAPLTPRGTPRNGEGAAHHPPGVWGSL